MQLAIIFAQFLYIHPFLDGNGRTSRLLSSGYLIKKRLITHPALFFTRYVRIHRFRYMKGLYDIEEDENWDNWIEFIFKALHTEIKLLLSNLHKLLSVYEIILLNTPSDLNKSKKRKLTLFFFTYPVFQRSDFFKNNPLSLKKGTDFLSKLQKKKIISRKSNIYLVHPLILIGEKMSPSKKMSSSEK